MKKIGIILILIFIGRFTASSQPSLQNDFSYSMEVPGVAAMESSAAHLYILSESEGMAVFRTRQDSVQWLYTASGMQQRGATLQADIRFAYLFGNSRRLTVLEPTSVMGAYSSTTLPNTPLDAVRVDENLYVALGEGGLGRLNLQTPETLDSPVQPVESDPLQSQQITDLESSSTQLFALGADQTVFVFHKNENTISFDRKLTMDRAVSRIFFVNETLMGTTENGDIVEITGNGSLNELGNIGEPAAEIKFWNDWLVIRGTSNRLWTSYQFTEPTLWKQNQDGGNYLAVSKGQLWISEYDRISRVTEIMTQARHDTSVSTASKEELQIQPISDQIIPYPHALLLPLKLKGNYPIQNVTFSVQSDGTNAEVRGQSLYWKPEARSETNHRFKVVATGPGGQTSTTSFTVNVRPFNTPPRFTPLRTISIPVGQPFNLPIRASDPDGMNKDLIRYLGVNLPNGASIDEQSGELNWTPTERQVGKNSFRVIATDQYGAASSVNVTIRVLDTTNEQN